MSEAIDVAAVAKQPTQVRGSLCGWKPTRDDQVSYIELNVHYLAADNEDLGTAQVTLSDGIIADAMGDCYEVAAAAAAGAGLEPGDAGHPERLDPQAAWSAVKTRMAELIADPAVTTVAGIAGAFVTLLAQAGPGGTYPQKWGKHILVEAYRRQVK